MKEIRFRYTDAPTAEALHRALGRTLDFPEYYGRNLDALWDCLIEIDLPIRFIWEDYDSLDPDLHEEAAAILSVLEEYAGEEPEFQVRVD